MAKKKKNKRRRRNCGEKQQEEEEEEEEESSFMEWCEYSVRIGLVVKFLIMAYYLFMRRYHPPPPFVPSTRHLHAQFCIAMIPNNGACALTNESEFALHETREVFAMLERHGILKRFENAAAANDIVAVTREVKALRVFTEDEQIESNRAKLRALFSVASATPILTDENQIEPAGFLFDLPSPPIADKNEFVMIARHVVQNTCLYILEPNAVRYAKAVFHACCRLPFAK